MIPAHLRLALLTATALLAIACGSKSPVQPSPMGPTTSSLAYQVAAGAGNPATSGAYTTANATFGASVRTTCVPNPNILGSVCPDLMVRVRGNDNRLCTMWAFAPVGRTLTVGSYPTAAFSPTNERAGFFLNCGSAGTTCGDSASSFTVDKLQSNASGVVTRLHLTFEQTCLGGFPPSCPDPGD
jgi:hypothetical protein